MSNVKSEVQEVFVESADDESDKSSIDMEEEIQDILQTTNYQEQQNMIQISPDKSGYEDEHEPVKSLNDTKHIQRVNRAHLNKSSFAPSSAPMTNQDISRMELLGDILNQQDDMASVSVMLAESFDDDETG